MGNARIRRRAVKSALSETVQWGYLRCGVDRRSGASGRQFPREERKTVTHRERRLPSFFLSNKPLFTALRNEYASDPKAMADEVWLATLLLDELGLLTTEGYQKSREEVSPASRKKLLELSTPVVRLWENVLALPLIGTLDSARTQVVMQNLLEAIVQTRSDFAIIDITGVPWWTRWWRSTC